VYIGLRLNKVPVTFCHIVMKLEFSGQIFEKYSNV
jgi:hypothetical protein